MPDSRSGWRAGTRVFVNVGCLSRLDGSKPDGSGKKKALHFAIQFALDDKIPGISAEGPRRSALQIRFERTGEPAAFLPASIRQKIAARRTIFETRFAENPVTDIPALPRLRHLPNGAEPFLNGDPLDPLDPDGKHGKPTAFPENSARVLIGMRHNGAGNAFLAGGIEDIRLHGRALTGRRGRTLVPPGSGRAAAGEVEKLLTPEQRRERDSLLAQLATLRTALGQVAANPTQPTRCMFGGSSRPIRWNRSGSLGGKPGHRNEHGGRGGRFHRHIGRMVPRIAANLRRGAAAESQRARARARRITQPLRPIRFT